MQAGTEPWIFHSQGRCLNHQTNEVILRAEGVRKEDNEVKGEGGGGRGGGVGDECEEKM